MRTAVHPDRPFLLVSIDVLLDGDELLADRIALFPDAQLQRPPVNVSRRVNLALVFRRLEPQRVPTERPLASRVIHRKAQVIDERGAGDALGLILLVTGAPDARKVSLAE